MLISKIKLLKLIKESFDSADDFLNLEEQYVTHSYYLSAIHNFYDMFKILINGVNDDSGKIFISFFFTK